MLSSLRGFPGVIDRVSAGNQGGCAQHGTLLGLECSSSLRIAHAQIAVGMEILEGFVLTRGG